VRGIAGLLMFGAVGAIAAACGRNGDTDADCIPPPCPAPMAIDLRVSSAAGGPVPGLTVDFAGSTSGRAQCNVELTSSRCFVPGGYGTYQLRVAAPGFRPAELSVVVPGSAAPRCGCPTVQTQALDVVLEPSEPEELAKVSLASHQRGRRIAISGITIYRMLNGRIQEAWEQLDLLGMWQQLGVFRRPGDR
jgi:SnoaL-like polyketide cyclase